MVVRALDHVRHCNTAADGKVINSVLMKRLAKGQQVKLSFANVFDVPSSFVNTAIVALLDTYNESFIKSNLTIIDANRQIADMIRRCLANGVRRKQSVGTSGTAQAG